MFNKPTTGIFGSSGNTSFGFGTSGFGTQATTAGLFGPNTTATPSTGGIFGGSTNTFGSTPATNTGFSFGAATATVQPTLQTGGTGGVLFGTSNTGFGTAAPQTASLPLFGTTTQPMNGSTFGGQAGTMTGLFGGSSFLGANSSGAAGTVIKFVPVTGSDVMMKAGTQQSVSTKLQCITGMKEYESKSLEELRLEDYLANRKGPQPQQQQTGLGFLGATSQTTQASSAFGVFGQPSKPAFTGFGTTPSTGTSSLFGQTQTQQPGPASIFGTASQPKSLFGTAATTTAAASPFGGLSSNTSIFGQNTAAKPGLFGTTPVSQTTGLFGTTPAATSSTSVFGNVGFGGSSTFGTGNTGGGLFAQKPAGFGGTTSGQVTNFSFGQGQQQPNLLVGTPATGGGLFGTKSTPSSTGFSFGQATNASFGGFGTPAASSALGTNTAPFGTGLGLTLGNVSSCGTSLFQQPQSKSSNTALGFTGFGSTGATTSLGVGNIGTTLGSGIGLGSSADLTAAILHQQQQIQQQLQILNTSPYGDSPLFRNLKQDSSRKDELLKPTNPDAQKVALAASSQLKVTGRPNYKIKPKPLQSIITGKGQLFDGLEEDESILDGETFVPRHSFKKLVIKNNNSTTGDGSRKSLNSPPPLPFDNDIQSHTQHSFGHSNGVMSTQQLRDRSVDQEASYSAHSEIDNTIGEYHSKNRMVGSLDNQKHENSYNEHDDDDDDTYSNLSNIVLSNHPTGIVLHRPDYFTIPTLNELVEMMDTNGECWVENFVVGRDGYGNVAFLGLTNVMGLNLDEIVHFRSKEIDVYPNEDNKPPVGQGLNKKAQVTLDRVWPVDKTTNEVIQDYDRLLKMGYLEKLEKASRKVGAKFLDYRHETGSWVFEVKHFSKYGLLDDDDDDDDYNTRSDANKKQQQHVDHRPMPQKQSELSQKTIDAQTGQCGLIDDSKKKTHLASGFVFTMEDEDAEMPDMNTHESMESQMHMELPESHEEEWIASSSVCLPKSFGISATQVQLQKASFFGNSEEDAADTFCLNDVAFLKNKHCVSSSSMPLEFPSCEPQKQSASPYKMAVTSVFGTGDIPHLQRSLGVEAVISKFNRKKSFEQQELVVPLVQHPLMHSALTTDWKKPSKMQISLPVDFIPYEESVFAGKQSLLMDSGLVHCRRSRVGWAAGWTLAHPGHPLTAVDSHGQSRDESKIVSSNTEGCRNETKKTLQYSSPANVIIESIGMSGTLVAEKAMTDLLTQCLEVELENSSLLNEMDCPLYKPSTGIERIHSYCDKMQKLPSSCELTYLMSMTWTLCKALWGDVQQSEEFMENSYACHQARKFSFAQWLTLATESTVKHEIQKNRDKGNDGSVIVFNYLSGGMLEKACEHALLCQDYHLALLIAEVSSSEDCKTMILRQLAMWEETLMDNFISKDYLQLYAVLAGTLVWRSSEELINTCANLDWKRCLALHLWFMCSSNATIKECLEEYEKAVSGNSVHGKYASPPRPSYIEKLGHDDEGTFDVFYHLLKLYCDRTYPLHVLLNPSTMSGNQLDYSLSWHLLQVLEGLGFCHLSDVHHSMICTSYASQLESLGQWHWAVFVLLHIRNHDSRADAVRQLLMRCVSIDLQQDHTEEDFIVNCLHVKPEWIHQSKAVKAKSKGCHFEEAWHLLKAKQWNQCHGVIKANVAPEAIVNGNYDMLRALLKPLADAQVSCQIKDWHIGGGLYVDYIGMMDQFQQINQFVKQGDSRDDFGYEKEHLRELASSLFTRIFNVPYENYLESRCQVTMAQSIAKVMSVLIEGQAEQEYISMSANWISSLPLPEDFTLGFLAKMLHHAQQVILS